MIKLEKLKDMLNKFKDKDLKFINYKILEEFKINKRQDSKKEFKKQYKIY